MVYHNQNYWVYGLFPLSGILGTRKHDVSETGSVSVLMSSRQPAQRVEVVSPPFTPRKIPGTHFY
jgi:hypothetical protein